MQIECRDHIRSNNLRDALTYIDSKDLAYSILGPKTTNDLTNHGINTRTQAPACDDACPHLI